MGEVEVAHQRAAGTALEYLVGGAAHVDVADLGADGLDDPRGLGSDPKICTEIGLSSSEYSIIWRVRAFPRTMASDETNSMVTRPTPPTRRSITRN
jgi:hypothetical protein